MPEADRELLRSRLRQAREYLGLTQEFVAKHTGIPRTAINEIENGKRRVDSLELKRLADVYRYSVAYFLGDEEPTEVPASITALARATRGLTDADRAEVLRYAEYLRNYKQTGGRKKQ